MSSSALPADAPGTPASRAVGERAIPRGRLAAMLAAALVLAVWAARVVPERLAPPAETPPTPLVALDPAAVRGIHLRRGGVDAWLRRGGDGSWRLDVAGEPAGVAIDGQAVESFLGVLRTTARLTQFVEPDLAAFGLDPPRGVVTLESGSETEIRFGDRNPPLTAVYVQVLPAPDIVLVGSIAHWELDRLAALVAREAGQPAQGADPPVRR